MNTAERIVSFLRKHQNMTICDDCLQAELGVSKPISRMLDVLNPEFVRREVSKCGRCGETKNSVALFKA